MTPRPTPRFRFSAPAPGDADWRTLEVRVPPSRIAHFCFLFEGHDNLALVRTRSREEGLLHLWFHHAAEPTVRALIAELDTQFPVVVESFASGMAGLDEVYPPEANETSP